MKRIALALLFSLAVLPAAYAQAPTSKQAKIEELIRITKLDQLMGQMSQQMTARMKQTAAQQSARHAFTPEQQKAVDDYIAQIEKITQSAVSWDKVKPTIVQVYSETYTDQELDGILAFYHSPSGQALVAKSPQLMTRTMQLVQSQMGEVQPQIQAANDEFSRKMKELSGPPSSSPSTTPQPSAQPKP
jgi:hypothetical protein